MEKERNNLKKKKKSVGDFGFISLERKKKKRKEKLISVLGEKKRIER